MASVTAAEVQKDFGQHREAALEELFIATACGEPSVAIISTEECERMTEFDCRVMRSDEMSDAQIEGMVAAEIPPELRYSLDDVPDRPSRRCRGRRRA